MNKAEHQQLINFINKLSEAINKLEQTNDPENVYDISAQINAVYGNEIDGLSDAYETMSQQSGLAKRSANTILALLNRYKISNIEGDYIKDEIDDTFLSYASDILADTNKGLSGMQIAEYCNAFAVEYNKSIPFSNYPSNAPNKRVALKQNLKVFTPPEQFRIIKELCEHPNLSKQEKVQELKSRLFLRYGNLATEKISETELVQKTKHWLENYPSAFQKYEDALSKYENGIFERNALDDMRLSFEFLVKDLLGNGKSLENQISDIGTKLKESGASEELRNMVVKVIDYYTKFQNNHVKHNDSVNEKEMEYIIELTSVLMKFLIKMLGDVKHG